MSHAADADAHTGGFGVLSTGFGFPGEMGPSAGLARLARDLSTTDSDRPESWAASAMYWSSKGDSTRALDHAERARFARTIATPARSWSRGTCV